MYKRQDQAFPIQTGLVVLLSLPQCVAEHCHEGSRCHLKGVHGTSFEWPAEVECVSQYTSAFIVIPCGRTSTKSQPFRSQKGVAMIFSDSLLGFDSDQE